MKTKRRLSILGVFFIVGLLVMVWLGWKLVRAVKSAASGPKITISRETTFIEVPLDENGDVDYVAALNAISSDGVTPENNAVVLFWQAFGPGRPSEQVSDQFFEMIEMERPANEGRYLIAEEDYRLREWLAAEADAGNQPVEPAENGITADEIREQLARATRSPWTVEECPAVAELLEANGAPLETIIEGTRRPKYYAPMVPIEGQRTIIGMFVPTRNRCSREAAQFLLARAMLRLGQGKTDEAWQDLLACHRTARLVAQGPLVLDGLVGASIERMALSGDSILATTDLTAEQAERFLAELQSLGPISKMPDKIVTGERYLGLDAIADYPNMTAEVMQEDSFLPGGELGRSLSQMAANLALDMDEILRTYNALYDRLVDAVARPTRAERVAALDQLDRELDQLNVGDGDLSSVLESVKDEGSMRTVNARKLGLMLFIMLHDDLAAGLESEDRIKSQLDVTRIALALAACLAEQGEYPENLADLSPDYLAEIPKDLFAEYDFRYARTDAAYLLYGVGPNGKDEGGHNYERDYGHLEVEQIPEDADYETDDIAIRVPPEKP